MRSCLCARRTPEREAATAGRRSSLRTQQRAARPAVGFLSFPQFLPVQAAQAPAVIQLHSFRQQCPCSVEAGHRPGKVFPECFARHFQALAGCPAYQAEKVPVHLPGVDGEDSGEFDSCLPCRRRSGRVAAFLPLALHRKAGIEAVVEDFHLSFRIHPLRQGDSCFFPEFHRPFVGIQFSRGRRSILRPVEEVEFRPVFHSLVEGEGKGEVADFLMGGCVGLRPGGRVHGRDRSGVHAGGMEKLFFLLFFSGGGRQ